MRRFLNILAGLMLVSGFVILAWPFAARYIYGITSKNAVNEFKERYGYSVASDEGIYVSPKPGSDSAEDENTGNAEDSDNSNTENYDKEGINTSNMAYKALYNEMQEYNERIFSERQAELKDAFSYTTNDFDFQAEGLYDDMIGYITIPAMDIVLPLYIGANRDNLAKGATVLSKTSMPIGGKNTNTVIAGHRGYRGQEMFVNIEALELGDDIYISNLWGRMHYTVAGITQIDPYDIDKIKIIEGEEMVTLVTCHPYHHNYLRYVVYCVRDYDNETTGNGGESASNTDLKEHSAALASISKDMRDSSFESSTESIASYYILNIIGLVLVGVILIVIIIIKIYHTYIKCGGK